jgi:hypothetical protein
MAERFFTKEECQRNLAQAQAEMIVWMSFLQALDEGEFVLVDESFKEPRYRIAKAGRPLIAN